MNLIKLKRINKYEFKRNSISTIELDVKKWIQNPSNFKLAIQCSDGRYSCVHSEISQILSSNVNALRIRLKQVISELIPNDPIHGQRFVIYEDNPETYLLGTVEAAMMLLAEGK